MSNRIPIKENVKRKLYAESMGRCMNPNCLKEISFSNCDILEIAHIESYADTKNNSFDNLVI